MGHILAMIIDRSAKVMACMRAVSYLGVKMVPHRSVLLGYKLNVFMMRFTQNGRHFPLRAKGRNVPGADICSKFDASAAFDHKGLRCVASGVHLPCYGVHRKFG
jgi:hypothetical protein